MIQPLVPQAQAANPGQYGFAPCEGGVCAAAGVRAAGVSAGFRRNPKRLDLALVVADEGSVCAATFTQNRFCAAPVQISRERAARHTARAIMLNSGNANAATGEQGLQIAKISSRKLAQALGMTAPDVLVASTGVIGVQLPLGPFEHGIPLAVAALDASPAAAHDAACAVMTTDTVPKEVAVAGRLPATADAPARTVHVGGFVKGSGMIQPNMATMLAVISTDAPLTPCAAQSALQAAVARSFNKVTVDSDSSTNDSCFLLATGAAGGPVIDQEGPEYAAVAEALAYVCEQLARKIAADGEGATKLVTVDVIGAATPEDADTVARSIANSPLVKTAIFGHDANWGRIAGAAGKCGVDFDQAKVDIDLLGVPVCRAGLTVPFSEEEMLRLFSLAEVPIVVDLHMGDCATRVWTCDLTHDYVTINGDYRT